MQPCKPINFFQTQKPLFSTVLSKPTPTFLFWQLKSGMVHFMILHLSGILSLALCSILPSVIHFPTCRPWPYFTPTPFGPLNKPQPPLHSSPQHSFVHFLATHQPGLTSRAEFLGFAPLVVVLNLLLILKGLVFWEILLAIWMSNT